MRTPKWGAPDCPHDCPCELPKQGIQSQQEPNRPIEEVVEAIGFARKTVDVREADFRLAQADFEAVSKISQFSRIDARRSFPEGAVTARLYWKSP
jgi:hypothetical protein